MPQPTLTNGPAAAAILAAAVGCFTLGVVQLVADLSKPFNKFLVFSTGAGALSGETTIAIALWLVLWFGLDRVWGRRTVALTPILGVAYTLLAVGAVLTFPPIADLF